MQFINLRNYSESTFLTGVPKPKEYPAFAKKLGLSAVAITDKNKAYGIFKFFKSAKENDIKPLIGVNVISEEVGDNILVFPQDVNGHRNYNLLLTDLALENKGSLFEFDDSALKFMTMVFAKESVEAKGIEYIVGRFGENAFFEFQPSYGEEYFRKLEKEVGIEKIAITNPTYFLKKEDLILRQLKKAIKEGIELTDITDDFTENYFKTAEEIRLEVPFISDEEFVKILSNNEKIAEMTNAGFELGVYQIPKFEIEGEDLEIFNKYSDRSKLKLSSDEWYLRYLCYSNFQRRYGYELSLEEVISMINKDDFKNPENGLTKTSVDELKELSKVGFPKEKMEILERFDKYGRDLVHRLEYELYVIHNMGFDAYFLIVSDYINKGAKDRGIAVGPGRGSAAGSLAAYLSKITDVDPIKYGLLFERFLSPSRVNMPDVDTDFADVNRQDVIEYCAKKYGRDQVVAVSTFGTFAARSAIKDVGKRLGLTIGEANRLASLVNGKPGTKLKKEYEEDNPKFRQAIDASETFTEVYRNAIKLEGSQRQLGVHACATIISPKPLTEFSPLQNPPKKKGGKKTTESDSSGDMADDYKEDAVITQLEAHDLEDLGLLKMDFLGLKNMTIMQNAMRLIKERKGVEIESSKIPLDDKETYDKVFSEGETTAVFQFESRGMRKYLKQLQADKFEELIAMVSLYRPGPLEFIPSFIDRKHGREPIKYLNAVLEELMKETYGHCVHGDTLITFSDGSVRKIRDIYEEFKKYEGKKLVTYDVEKNELSSGKLNFAFDNGEKDFFRVKYGNGKFIEATGDHKVYVYDSESSEIAKKKVSELTGSDFLLTPKKTIGKKSSKRKDYDKNKALISAYLIGDGEISTGNTVSFVNSDKVLLDSFINAVSTSFPTTNFDIRENKKGTGVTRVTAQDPNNRNYKGENTLLAYLRSVGLKNESYKEKGLNSRTKFIPYEILNSSDESKAFFIAKLWDCDGGVAKNGVAYYTTVSKDIHDGLVSMLESIGISASSYVSSYGEGEKSRTLYKIHVKDSKKFYEFCGKDILSAEKKIRIEKSAKDGRKNKESMVPVSMVRKWISENGRSHKFGTAIQCSENKLKELSKKFGTKLALCETDAKIYETFNLHKFDKLEPIGKSKAYDLEVDGDHNYLARRTVVSNCVYQEQIMLMSQIYSGYSMAEADELRKGIGKKNKEIIAKHEEKFVNGAVNNNHDHDEAENIYKKVVVPAGSYSFNKSHAACYAKIAFDNADLKTHFPSEFLTANFMSDCEDQERVALLTKEFTRLGGKVLPPHVNHSEENYVLEKEGVIRMGFATIKGIGTAPSKELTDERKENGPFRDIMDYLERAKARFEKYGSTSLCDKKVIEGLVRADAFEGLIDQNELLANLATVQKFIKGELNKKTRKKKVDQTNVFDLSASVGEENVEKSDRDKVFADTEWLPATGYEMATRQLEALGVMVSHHPLDGLSKYAKGIEKNREVMFGTTNNNYVSKDEKRTNVFGYLESFRINKNSAGREIMNMTITGVDYDIDAACYAEKTEEYRYDVEAGIGKFVDMEGTFSVSTYGRTLNVKKLMVLEPLKHIERMKVRGTYDEKERLDVTAPYMYRFAKVDPYVKLYVAINPGEELEKLKEYLKDFKEFLQRQDAGSYHVILKDVKGGLKDTKFYIKDYKTVLNFFKRVKKWARIFIEDKEQLIPKEGDKPFFGKPYG